VRSIHEFIVDLKEQGYSVQFDASVKGKSGVVHHVDVLAESPEGKKIVGLERHGKETAVEILNAFVVALDGEAEACYIVDRNLDEEDRNLAEHYKITLLTGGA
jgi:hypothetical protein